MTRYRVQHKYPYYNGCIPIDVWIVQKLERGLFSDKWVNIKGFDTPEKAQQLCDLLND